MSYPTTSRRMSLWDQRLCQVQILSHFTYQHASLHGALDHRTSYFSPRCFTNSTIGGRTLFLFSPCAKPHSRLALGRPRVLDNGKGLVMRMRSGSRMRSLFFNSLVFFLSLLFYENPGGEGVHNSQRGDRHKRTKVARRGRGVLCCAKCGIIGALGVGESC